MNKFSIKFISLVIIIVLNASGLLAVGEALAYFSDNEGSLSNSLSTGTLDFSLSSADDFLPDLTQSQPTSNRTVNLSKDGTLGFKYKVKVETAIGGLCSYLSLKDNLSNLPQSLSNFVSDETTFSAMPSLIFTSNSSSYDESLQGEICNFDIVFEAWQENLSNNTQGFTDKEIINSTVKMGYWNSPVVLNEFLPNADNYPEFIELYNKTGSSIDLAGFYIKTNSSTILIDSSTTAQYSSGITTIAGNSWLVVTADGDKMGDDSDVIILYDENDIKVDSYEYDARVHNVNNTPGETNNLVAYLPFDGDLLDKSGNGNNGSYNGDAIIVGSGKINQALSLDGDGDYVTIADSDDFNFGLGEFSIESWFKTTNSSRQWLLARYENYGPGWGIGTQNNHSLGYIRTFESGSGKTEIEGTINVSDNAWHHLVMIRTGDDIKIYTDGNLKAEGILAGNINNDEPVEIGRISWSGGSQYLNGLIDEVKIYNRALDADEVLEHYNDVGVSIGEVPVDKSYARIPDGSDNWVDPIPTPGAPNQLDIGETVAVVAVEVIEVVETANSESDEVELVENNPIAESVTEVATTIATTATTTIATTTEETASSTEVIDSDFVIASSTEDIILEDILTIEATTTEVEIIDSEESLAPEEEAIIEEEVIAEEIEVDIEIELEPEPVGELTEQPAEPEEDIIIEETPAIEEESEIIIINQEDENNPEEDE